VAICCEQLIKFFYINYNKSYSFYYFPYRHMQIISLLILDKLVDTGWFVLRITVTVPITGHLGMQLKESKTNT